MLLGYFIYTFPVVAVLSLLCYLPSVILQKKRHKRRRLLRHLTLYACIGVVWSILFLTIFWGGFPTQFPVEYHFLNLVPFIWVKETYAMGFAKMIEQLVLNIAMFVPLGLLVPLALPSFRHGRKLLLSVLVFVCGIETVQYFIGRSADVDDVIMNAAGSLLGYGIFYMLHTCLRRKKWWSVMLGTEDMA